MKARPIIFSGPMVRALLDGTKTQTRRLVKPPFPAEAKDAGVIASGTASNGVWWWLDSTDLLEASTVGDEFRCPYGVPGDLLWVREAFGRHLSIQEFRGWAADGWQPTEKHDRLAPSRHLPRAWSRLTLELTDVRVQRLHEISQEDARAEGARICAMQESRGLTHRSEFSGIWAEIHGAESWHANPWVWALTFEVLRENVDAVLERAKREDAPCAACMNAMDDAPLTRDYYCSTKSCRFFGTLVTRAETAA